MKRYTRSLRRAVSQSLDTLESRIVFDNTLATANDLGTMTGAFSRSDVVNNGDTVDFYKVALAQQSELHAFVTNTTGGVKLRLIRDANNNGNVDAGEVIGEQTAINARVDVTTLLPGTYFAEVDRAGNDTNYTLTLSKQSDTGGGLPVNARDVGTPGNTVFSDSVAVGPDTNDFFKLPLTDGRQITVQASGLSQNVGIRVIRDVINPNAIDAGEEMFSQSSTSPGAGLTRTFTVSPGTYFIQVFATSATPTNYNLSIATTPSNHPDDNGGDSPQTPHAIGPLDTSPHAFSEFVGDVDAQDYFGFSLSKLSVIHSSIRGLTADADLQIIRLVNSGGFATEQVVLSSPFGGTSDEVIDGTLVAGDYFAKVFQHTGGNNTNYLLNLQVTQTDGAGETPAAARDTGTLGNTSKTFNDRIGGVDTDDFYKFTLTGFRTVTAKLSGLNTAIQADADLTLLKADGTTVITTSSHAGSADENAVASLLPGTYFARVTPELGESNYTLKLSTVVGPDAAGQTLATAKNVGSLAETVTLTAATNEFVGGTDDSSDIYKVTMTRGAQLHASGINGGTISLIVDKNGNGIIDSGEETNVGTGATALVPGTYFYRIKPTASGGTLTYSLSLSTIVADTAGNSRAAAKDLGGSPFNSAISRGYVGSDDTSDVYKFSALGVFPFLNFKITLSGLSSNADLSLLDSNGNALATSSHSGTTSETINFSPLVGGTFFIKVGRVSGNSLYKLTLTA